eukprot:7383221-Prymnesium_polylepis.1
MGRSRGSKRQRVLDVENEPTSAAAAAADDDAEWIELDDPKLRSRVLYANPVCVLSTVDEEQRRRNAMVVSWLTPTNNHGVFVMAINRQRHTAPLLLGRRAFCLSPAVAGMEEML